MANRTTVKSNIQVLNVPSVSNADLEDMLNDNICDNVKFREDVVVAQTSLVSSITVDFTGKDTVNLTRTGGSLSITISNLGDGETKFLLITKSTGQTVSFVGVTDVTPVAADVTALGTVLYEITRKSSSYFARAYVPIGAATTTRAGILETATVAEGNSLSATDKIITPGTIPKGSTSQEGVVEIATSSEIDAGTDNDGSGDQLVVQPSELIRKLGELETSLTTQQAWQNGSGLSSGWSGTIQYFKDNMGNVHVRTNNLARSTGFTGTSGQPVWPVPAGYRPDASCVYVVSAVSGAFVLTLHKAAFIDSGGGAYYLYIFPEPDDYPANSLISFYLIYQEA